MTCAKNCKLELMAMGIAIPLYFFTCCFVAKSQYSYLIPVNAGLFCKYLFPSAIIVSLFIITFQKRLNRIGCMTCVMKSKTFNR